jgi:hypothetical protein
VYFCIFVPARVKATPASPRLSRAFANAVALEEHPESIRKKERMSRQERTALVESFVLKCVSIFIAPENNINNLLLLFCFIFLQ